MNFFLFYVEILKSHRLIKLTSLRYGLKYGMVKLRLFQVNNVLFWTKINIFLLGVRWTETYPQTAKMG